MQEVTIKLSDHFTLAELTKTNTKIENVPNEAQVENLKRLCGWLEKLRARYNERYVCACSDHPAHTGTPPNLGGEKITPIIAKGSNHLTGCAVDIRVSGIEQLVRYATILLDISDESQKDFDELLLERSPQGSYWLHFAVRPKDNRRKVRLILT